MSFAGEVELLARLAAALGDPSEWGRRDRFPAGSAFVAEFRGGGAEFSARFVRNHWDEASGRVHVVLRGRHPARTWCALLPEVLDEHARQVRWFLESGEAPDWAVEGTDF